MLFHSKNLFFLLLALFLTACNGGSGSGIPPSNNPGAEPTIPPPTTSPTAAPTVTPTDTPSPRPTATPTPVPTAEPTPTPTPVPTITPDDTNVIDVPAEFLPSSYLEIPRTNDLGGTWMVLINASRSYVDSEKKLTEIFFNRLVVTISGEDSSFTIFNHDDWSREDIILLEQEAIFSIKNLDCSVNINSFSYISGSCDSTDNNTDRGYIDDTEAEITMIKVHSSQSQRGSLRMGSINAQLTDKNGEASGFNDWDLVAFDDKMYFITEIKGNTTEEREGRQMTLWSDKEEDFIQRYIIKREKYIAGEDTRTILSDMTLSGDIFSTIMSGTSVTVQSTLHMTGANPSELEFGISNSEGTQFDLEVKLDL